MSQRALRLVPTAPAYRRELDLPSDRGHAHSIHQALSVPDAGDPDVYATLVDRFTAPGGVVCDPFSGAGTVAVESFLRGRRVVASDLDPLAVKIVRAKIEPCDLTEITLGLQLTNLRAPIDLKLFDPAFKPFFDLETFREIVNLRSYCRTATDRTKRFVELIVLGILHGHSAGYLSVYTYPQVSVLPEDQQILNDRRNQRPDYRAVAPRILRRVASVLRDGVPSLARSLKLKHEVLRSDPRQLGVIQTGAVDLVLTAPPTTFSVRSSDEQWLRHWFAGTSAPTQAVPANDPSAWLDFMNETLLEMARLVKPRGRVCLDLPETIHEGNKYAWDELLAPIVDECLGRWWEVEGVMVYPRISAKERDVVRAQGNGDRFGSNNRVLVLRRR